LAEITKFNAHQILQLYGNILVHLSSLPLLLYTAFDHTWQNTKWNIHIHTHNCTNIPQSSILWVELANVHKHIHTLTCPPYTPSPLPHAHLSPLHTFTSPTPSPVPPLSYPNRHRGCPLSCSHGTGNNNDGKDWQLSSLAEVHPFQCCTSVYA